jgi:hypothetical protein
MLLYYHTASPTYVRCDKFVQEFQNHQIDYTFLGAQRKGVQVWESDANCRKSKFRFGHGFLSILPLISYILEGVILLRRTRPDKILITNEELYLIPLLARYKGIVILDAIDALDIRTNNTPGIIHRFFVAFTLFVRRRVSFIIEVEEFRSERLPEFKNKTFVLRNIPEDIDFPQIIEPRDKAEKYIFAWGSLNEDVNGVEKLIAAVDFMNKTRKDKIKILIAGVIRGANLLQMISERENILTLGFIERQECFSLLDNCLAAFAFYKPINQNFILAAPNKVYEALALGQFLLINSECKISSMCVEAGYASKIKFDDVNGISSAIEGILRRLESGEPRPKPVQFDSRQEWVPVLEILS